MIQGNLFIDVSHGLPYNEPITVTPPKGAAVFSFIYALNGKMSFEQAAYAAKTRILPSGRIQNNSKHWICSHTSPIPLFLPDGK